MALKGLRTSAAAQTVPSLDLARIEVLVVERQQARRQRDFARADTLRKELAGSGILVQDTPQGSTWTADISPLSPEHR